MDDPSTSVSPAADGGRVRVPVDDWAALQRHLRRFAGAGDVSVTDDRVVVSTGAARLVVTRDGQLRTGMPLHEFEKADVEALVFDHGDGHVEVTGPGGLRYEFRRP